MSDDNDLNEHGNHEGEFHQTVGGWAEYTVNLTEIKDTIRHDVTVPPKKIIPIIFLPGVMGSNLRMTKKRQEELKRPDNRSWRPDDMIDKSGKAAVATGSGLGGWFKNASPRDRQLIFDPNETEVEYYQYSSENGRFFPGGDVTKGSDARHGNIPDDFLGVSPLISVSDTKNSYVNSIQKPGVIGRFIPSEIRETPAHIARWRGWSEVLFSGAYGEMLQKTEFFMNNIIEKSNLRKGSIKLHWQTDPKDPETGKPIYQLYPKHPEITKLVLQKPESFGASAGEPLSQEDLRKISCCWYPVHAMGYNFIKSNSISAKIIAERIRGLVKGYQMCGFKCDEVILVTHSMGGLVARALIHPSYGNLLKDKDLKILGIYHNVMPTIGSASAYKRMRFGFKEKMGPINTMQAEVLGIDGQHATAVLANAPAPLEMMPGIAYGKNWLKVVDTKEQILWSWPQENQNALDSIYLKPDNNWWRLVNPLWINPANIPEAKGGGLKKVMDRLRSAFDFSTSIEKTFHPVTYASYCESKEFPSYGEIVFKVTEGLDGGLMSFSKNFIPPPAETWMLLTDDAKGTLTVQAGSNILTLKLQPASEPGDETVPALHSAKHINGILFRHGGKKDGGYEHQNSYKDPKVIASMLYSIIQMAKKARWDDQ